MVFSDMKSIQYLAAIYAVESGAGRNILENPKPYIFADIPFKFEWVLL